MPKGSSKPSLLKSLVKTIKEDPILLLSILIFGILLIVFSLLPIFGSLGPAWEKAIAEARWASMGVALTAMAVVLAKFVVTNEKIEKVERTVEEKASDLSSQIAAVEKHIQTKWLLELETEEYLPTLRLLMSRAKNRVMLMYFAETAQTDTSTIEYWGAFVELLKKKADQSLKFRRIATISSPEKLEAILANNAALFSAFPEKHSNEWKRIKYRLMYYPNPEIRPPQADIVDDAVMLFSPYSESSNQPRLWSRNEALVANFVDYYEGLWRFLESRGHMILDFANRDELKYKEHEVIQYMSIARAIGVSNEQRLFDKHIRPHTHLGFQAVIDHVKTKPAATSL